MKIPPATLEDAAGMAAVLKAVIALGGTTAHEVARTEAQVREGSVIGRDILS